MEIMRGKTSREMDAPGLRQLLQGYRRVAIDLGTGDGRYVRQLARAQPASFAIGIDACRENLQAGARIKAGNALFVIANAERLPCELSGLAQQLTVNFPWGSLLAGLLRADTGLMAGVAGLCRPGALLEVRLNAAALAEAGCPLEAGASRVHDNMQAHGFIMRRPAALSARDLRACPTTWARRLACGRDPRGVALAGVYAGQ